MSHPRFERFLDAMDALLAAHSDEPTLLDQASLAMQPLLAIDDWLPHDWRQPDAERYQSYPLYIDAAGRYSVISFVWGPGQRTGIHNHTVWGLVGVLQGAELCEEYEPLANGALRAGHRHTLLVGSIDRVSPTIGDIHVVSNALADAPTVSIHVYGADIGRVTRSLFTPEGKASPFVSGYSRAAPWVAARALRR